MKIISACHLIVDPPAGGAWNMAVDEALLHEVTESELPVLRFYEWERPTLSLGRFQRAEDRNQYLASLSADLVRRQSGGGAILHDREVTYSLMLPGKHPLSHDSQTLYDAVHQCLFEFLTSQIAPAADSWQLALCEPPSEVRKRDEPFFCFERRSRGDILLCEKTAASNYKIVGSAQRRSRGAVLQHGSILLEQSPAAPEISGIADLTGVSISPARFTATVSSQLSQSLGLDLQQFQIGQQITLEAEFLRKTKFGSPRWTQRR